ncbi:benzoate 4-monooxygenase cytochrome P450 [Setomelanomma holmii]|uniref:Benzoate 4-monooxygenase cytochrome P450 n=1 Tax=Setomelanomma holmii TaxID=210430 RepID=A0A9P4LQ17_9PLEO|nr:benzoate 4-monooxygenase cytochrome P450 [Setomelanomma holmii]
MFRQRMSAAYIWSKDYICLCYRVQQPQTASRSTGEYPARMILVKAIYNLYFHPLAGQPGPFFCRISGIPSFYYACRGDRHIWSWRMFQIYGDKFRATPNLLLFRTPEAYNCVFSHGANVKKSPFYDVWRRNKHDLNTLGCTNVKLHAKRRKALALAFTDVPVKATIPYIERHVDRWNDLLPGENIDADGWSDARDLGQWVDWLMFDLFGDVCFGKQNYTKEPGENVLKNIPHHITVYLKLYNPLAKSPLRSLLLWLKPRGLDVVMEAVTPEEVKEYFHFTEDLARTRIEAERTCELEKRPAKWEDMFHFLATARNPDTGEFAISTEDLIADANLLTVAWTDTTSTTIAALFFFVTRHPRVYTKLVKEIRENFWSAEEIGSSSDLMSRCEYLRAVIWETMRLSPPGPSEVELYVLKGGTTISEERFPEGVVVDIPLCSLGRNEEVYGDSATFRPERWICHDTYNTQENVNCLKRSYHPFSKGVGACLGQKMAMKQLCLIVGRTLWRYDVRKAAGETVGEGHPKLGWRRSNRNHYQLQDVYVSLREGPIVQFKRRRVQGP